MVFKHAGKPIRWWSFFDAFDSRPSSKLIWQYLIVFPSPAISAVTSASWNQWTGQRELAVKPNWSNLRIYIIKWLINEESLSLDGNSLLWADLTFSLHHHIWRPSDLNSPPSDDFKIYHSTWISFRQQLSRDSCNRHENLRRFLESVANNIEVSLSSGNFNNNRSHARVSTFLWCSHDKYLIIYGPAT